jgi:hypothetical protein
MKYLDPRYMAIVVLSLGVAAASALSPPPVAPVVPGVMTVRVDATNTGQTIFRVHQRLPVDPTRSGPLRLLYPRWLPGWHGPYGDVSQIAGLTARVGGTRLAWRRPADNPLAFDIDVPTGAAAVDVHFQWLGSGSNSPYPAPMTRDLLSIQWPSLTLVPAAAAHAGVQVQASVRLPAGWGWGSALRSQAGPAGLPDSDGWVHFEAESLETLMDSPLFAGAAYRRVELDEPGESHPAALHLFSDAESPQAPNDEQIAAHRRLGAQRRADRRPSPPDPAGRTPVRLAPLAPLCLAAGQCQGRRAQRAGAWRVQRERLRRPLLRRLGGGCPAPR